MAKKDFTNSLSASIMEFIDVPQKEPTKEEIKAVEPVKEKKPKPQQKKKVSKPMTQTTELRAYTLDEVAEIAQLNRRTLFNYIKDGKLKAAKFGRVWRISEENLRDFLNNGAE